MNTMETKRAGLTMLEFCRLMDSDPDGRGVRWRLMWRESQIIEVVPCWDWCGCSRNYHIETRKPETVWRVEYTKRRIDVISAEFRTQEVANASSCYGEFGTVTEIERPGEWVTWEPAANVSEQDAMIASLRSTLEMETVAEGLKRAVSDPGVCSWTYDGTHDKHDTQCGHSFTFVEGFPGEDGFTFCPYCGGRILEAPVSNEKPK